MRPGYILVLTRDFPGSLNPQISAIDAVWRHGPGQHAVSYVTILGTALAVPRALPVRTRSIVPTGHTQVTG
jgi:hypothetical protein